MSCAGELQGAGPAGMKQVVSKKAGGAWIRALEITHRLPTCQAKDLVRIVKVSALQGLSSAQEQRGREARGGFGYPGVGNHAGMNCRKQNGLF